MRGKFSIILMVGFMVSLCSLTTLAQGEEQKAQLFNVDDYAVNLSMVDEFEAGIKEWVAVCAKHKFPYPWKAYGTEDFHYIFVWPVENYADIDNMYKAFDELEEKMGEEQWQALLKHFEGTYEIHQSAMYYLIPERSYTPENPRLKSEEVNFISWRFYYIQSGKEEEFAEIDKEWVALYKSKNIRDGYNLYVGDMGTDMPMCVDAEWGKDAVDYFSEQKKINELLGEEATTLWKKAIKLCRKFEYKMGWYFPDLSYIPKEK